MNLRALVILSECGKSKNKKNVALLVILEKKMY